VLVAIVKKRLGLEPSLYTILQVLSISLFEKMPILRAFEEASSNTSMDQIGNQLELFRS
jgi:hypothetical protein